MALPVALGLAAPLAGHLADRIGARSLTVGGILIVVVGLVALAVLRPPTLVFVALLSTVGIGLGMFTSPNNAAIMGCVPRQQSGLASGILNMTRGMGTALGLALTALVFDLAGAKSPSSVDHAFSVTTLFLAVVSLLAALLAGLRGDGPLALGPGPSIQ
jgi:MFS family permease